MRDREVKKTIGVIMIMLGLLVSCSENQEQEGLLSRGGIVSLNKLSVDDKNAFSVVPDTIRKEDYENLDEGVILIRNGLHVHGGPLATKELIMVNMSEMNRLGNPGLLNLIYPVSKGHGTVENTDATETRSILLNLEENKSSADLLEKLNHIRSVKNTPFRDEANNASIELIKSVLNRCICEKYIKHIEKYDDDVVRGIISFGKEAKENVYLKSTLLEKLGLEEIFAYKLAKKAELFEKRNVKQELFDMFSSCDQMIDDMLKENRSAMEDQSMKFNKETIIISALMEKTIDMCNKTRIPADIINLYLSNVIACIKILTNREMVSSVEHYLQKREAEKQNESKDIKEDIESYLNYVLPYEIEEWNRELGMTFYEGIEVLSKFNGTLKELVEVIEKNCKCIHSKLNVDREVKYKKHMNSILLAKKYTEKIKLIEDLLKIQGNTTSDSIDTYNTSEDQNIFILDKEWLMEMIIGIVELCMNPINRKKGIKNIKEMIAYIAENYMTYGPLNKDIINEKKKQIVDIIIEISDESISEDRRIVALRNNIQDILNEVIDLLVIKRIEESMPTRYKEIKKQIRREEFSTEGEDKDYIFLSMIDTLKNYYERSSIYSDLYNPKEFISRDEGSDTTSLVVEKIFENHHNPNSSHSVLYNSRESIFKHIIEKEIITIEDIERAYSNGIINEWLKINAREGNIKRIGGLLEVLQFNQKINNKVNSYDEIWNNPIILYISRSSSTTIQNEGSKVVAAVGYMDKYAKKLQIEEVDYTEENLNIFRSANTFEEIRRILKYKPEL